MPEPQVFCEKCGTVHPSGPVVETPQFQPVRPPPSQRYEFVPPSPPAQQRPSAASKGGSLLLKIVLLVLILLFAGGAMTVAGLLYAGHRVSLKIRQIAEQLPAVDSSSSGFGSATGDACALLPAQDVSRAIGVDIVQVRPQDSGCAYLAKGDSAAMTSKHLTAFMKDRGADRDQQKTMQNISENFFKSVQNESRESGTDPAGDTVVLAFSVAGNGDASMRLNRSIFQRLGSGSQNISGVGDDAFDIAGGTMLVRKGTRLIRIVYVTCPCNTQAVIPLAKSLASAL
jgi:hypothetical protein